MPSADNKRVAKNAVALTIRMIIATIVGLYTSRIVITALGVDDYGIYGVIGGVVGMASFLNASMSGATSRFITYELGTGNRERLNRTFSTALIIHIFIALVVAILAETVGLWFVNNKMNFPAGSMPAVNVLYQFTIVSMMINFTQVPYSAAIIAHEKMNIYAYFEIINVILKLAIAYFILTLQEYRLIVYAGLILLTTIISALLYRIYCRRHFEETKFQFIWDKSIVRELTTFFGFDLYGNICGVVRNSSQPIIINIFFGVVANASASITSTVNGAIVGLTNVISQAFRPQIVKQYAVGKYRDMMMILKRSVQFTLLSYALLGIPVFVLAKLVLYLWLGQVPEYSVEFLRLIILAQLFTIVIDTNNSAIHATGNIKNISFIGGTIHLLCPIASYFVLKYLYHNVNVVYVINIIFSLILAIVGWLFIKIQLSAISVKHYIFTIVRTWLAIAVSFFIIYLITKFYNLSEISNWKHNLTSISIIAVVNCITILFVSLLIAVGTDDRKYLKSIIQQRRLSFRKSKS